MLVNNAKKIHPAVVGVGELWRVIFARQTRKSVLWRVIPAPNLGFRPPGPKIVQIGSIRIGFACGNSGAPETGIPAPKLRIRPTGPKIVRIGPNRIGSASYPLTSYLPPTSLLPTSYLAPTYLAPLTSYLLPSLPSSSYLAPPT